MVGYFFGDMKNSLNVEKNQNTYCIIFILIRGKSKEQYGEGKE